MGNTVLLTHSSGRSEKEEKKKKNTVFKPKNMTSIVVIKLVKWAGSHHPISKKFLAVQRINMTSVYTKNQADISKR